MVQANLTGSRSRHEFCSLKGMMPITKRFFSGATLFGLATAGLAQTDVSMFEAFACDSNGVATSVKVGEPFWVGARFKVTGQPNSTFKFRIESAFHSADSSRLAYGTQPGEYFVFWGPMPSLANSNFKVKATLDPEKRVSESNRANNSKEFTVNPIAPTTPIEFFAPRSISGRLGLNVQWRSNSGVPTEVTTWMPIPSTETFQQATGMKSAGDSHFMNAEPFAQALSESSIQPTNLNPITVESSIATTARSTRSNIGLLKQLGNTSDPTQAEWLGKEQLVELNRPEFRNWLNQVASPFHRRTMSTVEIAEAIYRSVLKRCTYEFRAGVAPSAYQTIRSKRGDCGALSSLFVALCRTSGIPARTVAGFGAGTDNWHVWAEFHVNGAGWVPVDPAFAEGRLAKGSDLPIYFGVIPELNERVATAFGLDRQVGNRSLPMLQSPAVFWTGSNVRLNKATAFSNLSAG